MRWLPPVVFLLGAAPALWLVYRLGSNQLGANPVDALTDATGTWALRLLLATLALTPLRLALRRTWPIRIRRMLGLFAFFYASLHISIYVALELEWSLNALVDDLAERPYVLAGTTAYLVLLPLAITSTRGWARRLKRRWIALHRWVYVAATAAVVHYAWLVRGDDAEPYWYATILLALLAVRFVQVVVPTRRRAPPPGGQIVVDG